MKMAFFAFALAAVLSSAAISETDSFDNVPAGAPPAGWTAGATGSISTKWSVKEDPTAPSRQNVLNQSGSAVFAWCVKKDVHIEDGHVEVKVKPIAGREDQAGGVIFRWKNSGNYYVARVNALEQNLGLFYMEDGLRHLIKYAHATVEKGKWAVLGASFSGKTITVTLDGKEYLRVEDESIKGPGAVGVWTKADSATSFDDFTYDAIAPQGK